MQIGGRQVQRIDIEAVVIRADGTREPLQPYRWDANPFRRIAWSLQRAIRKGAAHRGQSRHD